MHAGQVGSMVIIAMSSFLSEAHKAQVDSGSSDLEDGCAKVEGFDIAFPRLCATCVGTRA